MTRTDAEQDAVRALNTALDSAANAAAALDKTILSLSGGGLVFSMSFVGQMAPSKLCLPLLFVAWSFFALAVIGILVAMRRSQTEANKRVQKNAGVLENLEKMAGKAASAEWTAKVTYRVSQDSVMRWINWCALCAFLIGVICLGIFVGLNLAQSATPALLPGK